MKFESTIERLKELVIESKEGAQEGAHVEADYILREMLIKLGYKDIVDIYNKIDKWYS